VSFVSFVSFVVIRRRYEYLKEALKPDTTVVSRPEGLHYERLRSFNRQFTNSPNHQLRPSVLESVLFHLREKRLETELQDFCGAAAIPAGFLERLLDLSPLDFGDHSFGRIAHRS
jgi:hypothetical protein